MSLKAVAEAALEAGIPVGALSQATKHAMVDVPNTLIAGAQIAASTAAEARRPLVPYLYRLSSVYSF